MSHFLDRLSYFTREQETFSDGHGIVTTEDRTWERRLSRSLAARQDRALDPRRQLHGFVQLEDLRQGRRRHLGDAADRLPAHAPRHAEPRAARLLARRVAIPGTCTARNRLKYPMVRGRLRPRCGAKRSKTLEPVEAWASIVENPVKAKSYKIDPRPGRLRARAMGRGERDHRRGQRLHDQEVRPRPHHRLLADSGDVDGVLCRRQPVPVADRRRLHELLRLVLRPAAGVAADLGRADRRARVGRLVQLHLHHDVGLERAADPHAGRALLDRGRATRARRSSR